MATAIGTMLRDSDKDMFLASLFLPEKAQPAVCAIHAFAAELARIPQMVSEPQIGEIRLQWWADTLAAMADGGAQDHPLAAALAHAVREHGLPLKPLQDMMEARRFDLYSDRLPGLTALEAYWGEVQSVPFQLVALILAPAEAPAAATAAGLAGVSFGLARSLAVGGEAHWPVGVTRAALVGLSRKRLDEFRGLAAALPRQILPAFLPVALTELYLSAAEQGPAQVSQWRRQWRLWRAAKSEIF
jgi:phytoene synthase